MISFFILKIWFFSTKKIRTSFSYKKRKISIKNWKVISFFILKIWFFFQRKNEDKFLLQKEKNVNQKWKVVSFFILYFFNEKISTNFSYKKRKMSIKAGKWFLFLIKKIIKKVRVTNYNIYKIIWEFFRPNWELWLD